MVNKTPKHTPRRKAVHGEARTSYRDSPENLEAQATEAARNGLTWNAWAQWALATVLEVGVEPELPQD